MTEAGRCCTGRPRSNAGDGSPRTTAAWECVAQWRAATKQGNHPAFIPLMARLFELLWIVIRLRGRVAVSSHTKQLTAGRPPGFDRTRVVPTRIRHQRHIHSTCSAGPRPRQKRIVSSRLSPPRQQRRSRPSECHITIFILLPASGASGECSDGSPICGDHLMNARAFTTRPWR